MPALPAPAATWARETANGSCQRDASSASRPADATRVPRGQRVHRESKTCTVGAGPGRCFHHGCVGFVIRTASPRARQPDPKDTLISVTQVTGERLAGPEQDRPVLDDFFLVTRRCGCTKIARDVLEGRSYATTEGQGRGMLTSNALPRTKLYGEARRDGRHPFDNQPGWRGSQSLTSLDRPRRGNARPINLTPSFFLRQELCVGCAA